MFPTQIVFIDAGSAEWSPRETDITCKKQKGNVFDKLTAKIPCPGPVQQKLRITDRKTRLKPQLRVLLKIRKIFQPYLSPGPYPLLLATTRRSVKEEIQIFKQLLAKIGEIHAEELHEMQATV